MLAVMHVLRWFLVLPTALAVIFLVESACALIASWPGSPWRELLVAASGLALGALTVGFTALMAPAGRGLVAGIVLVLLVGVGLASTVSSIVELPQWSRVLYTIAVAASGGVLAWRARVSEALAAEIGYLLAGMGWFGAKLGGLLVYVFSLYLAFGEGLLVFALTLLFPVIAQLVWLFRLAGAFGWWNLYTLAWVIWVGCWLMAAAGALLVELGGDD